MKISKMIAELQKILDKEGDLRVTVFDMYTYAEGWDYNREELWEDASCTIDFVENDCEEEIEKIVLIN